MLLPNSGGDCDDGSWRQCLDAVAAQTVLPPFADLLMEFVHDTAMALLQQQQSRRYPDVVALGYWLRRAHVLEIRERYERKRQEALWGARGLALHFAPSNVDTIFMYSWFVSLLLGNSNVIRLSRQRGAQADWILDQAACLLEQDKYQPIRARTLVVSYDHDDEITAQLSAACHMRVIWGGDETVRRIRAIPLPPAACEMAFADKFSLAALEAGRVQASTDLELAKLVEGFYNDVFWFDQKACSSPRAVIWVGSDTAVQAARERFWPALRRHIEAKQYSLPVAAAMNRLVTAYDCAITGAVQHMEASLALPSLVGVLELTLAMRRQHCGGGLFFELSRSKPEDIAPLLCSQDQTLAVYGFAHAQLQALGPSWLAQGLCRVVPVGQALQFDVVWDGYDLLRMFTRELPII